MCNRAGEMGTSAGGKNLTVLLTVATLFSLEPEALSAHLQFPWSSD